mgnify:CR=1 FL=1
MQLFINNLASFFSNIVIFSLDIKIGNFSFKNKRIPEMIIKLPRNRKPIIRDGLINSDKNVVNNDPDI